LCQVGKKKGKREEIRVSKTEKQKKKKKCVLGLFAVETSVRIG
jgi:hypothetical protein